VTQSKPTTPITYADAGVSIDAGDAFVRAIAPLARATRRPGAAAGLGGFGALFDLKAAGFRDPVLVAGADGVGTKLKVAIDCARHDSVGIDLVAMCVNDLVVQGAEPLFFLDYFASGHLEQEAAVAVVRGIAEGCRQAGCALIGGETAEMPGMYAPGDYDLAGFAVGAAERDMLLDGARVRHGDAILGLASSGAHSNGFSLIRRLRREAGLDYGDPAPFAPGRSVGEALLTPTRIYVKSCLAALAAGHVNALAHITGGGLVDNVPRVLPDGACAMIDAGAWELPPVFAWARDVGRLPAGELARTFNCGIGMVVITPEDAADAAIALLQGHGERVYRIGRVEAGDGCAATRVSGAAGCWGYERAWQATGEAA